jgi:hypothetical protein
VLFLTPARATATSAPGVQQLAQQRLDLRSLGGFAIQLRNQLQIANPSRGYSGEIDHHSALKPITIPEGSDQGIGAKRRWPFDFPGS